MDRDSPIGRGSSCGGMHRKNMCTIMCIGEEELMEKVCNKQERSNCSA